MNLAGIIEAVYWPFTAVGLLCVGILWKKNVQQPWLYWIVHIALVAFVPTVLLVFFLSNKSVGLILAQDLVAVVVGGLCIHWGIRTKTAAIWHRIATGCLGLIFVTVWCWYIVGDYLLPRREVVGTVDRILVRGVFDRRYEIEIAGKRYPITADLLQAMRLGKGVTIEVGSGSGTVFRIADVRTRSELLKK